MTTRSDINTLPHIITVSRLLLAVGLLWVGAAPSVGEDRGVLKTLMVEKGKLVYQNTFDKPGPTDSHWASRKGTRWKAADGVLLGMPATEQHQKEKIDKGLKGFDTGCVPKVIYQDAPKDFVCSLRIRFTGGEPPARKWPHIEWGHHLLRVYFGKEALKFVSNGEKNLLGERRPGFERDYWYHILMERKGNRATVQIGRDYSQSGELNLNLGTAERPRFKAFQAGEPDLIGFAGSENGHVSIDDFFLWEAGDFLNKE